MSDVDLLVGRLLARRLQQLVLPDVGGRLLRVDGGDERYDDKQRRTVPVDQHLWTLLSLFFATAKRTEEIRSDWTAQK